MTIKNWQTDLLLRIVVFITKNTFKEIKSVVPKQLHVDIYKEYK